MSHSDTVGSDESTYWLNAWVWWLLIVSGFTIFIRGIYLYIRAKQNPSSVRGINHAEAPPSDDTSATQEGAAPRNYAFFYLY